MIEQALVLQNGDPGVDADEKARPEGRDGEQQQSGPQMLRRPRHGVGHGIGDREGEGGGDQRHAQGREIGLRIEPVVSKPRIGGEAEFAQFAEHPLPALRQIEGWRIGRLCERRLREGNLHDNQERDEEEHRQPHPWRAQHQPFGQRAPRAHAGMIRAASGGKLNRTEAPRSGMRAASAPKRATRTSGPFSSCTRATCVSPR